MTTNFRAGGRTPVLAATTSAPAVTPTGGAADPRPGTIPTRPGAAHLAVLTAPFGLRPEWAVACPDCGARFTTGSYRAASGWRRLHAATARRTPRRILDRWLAR